MLTTVTKTNFNNYNLCSCYSYSYYKFSTTCSLLRINKYESLKIMIMSLRLLNSRR